MQIMLKKSLILLNFNGLQVNKRTPDILEEKELGNNLFSTVAYKQKAAYFYRIIVCNLAKLKFYK